MTPRTRYTGYTEAQKRATVKYQKEKMDSFTVRVQKGLRAVIDQHRELTGESLSEFLRRAVMETIKRDKETMREALKKQALTENVQEPKEE
jgi:predicted HicB family RNase H-like nuclease